jgi:hypothetical protein
MYLKNGTCNESMFKLFSCRTTGVGVYIEKCKQIAQCSYEFSKDIKLCLENRFPLKLNGQ